MSKKLAVIANLNIHFFETCRFASLQIQPNGYGFGCGMVSRLIFLTKYSDINFACDPLLNNVSIFVCLDMTLTWNSSIISSSFGVFMWQFDVLVLGFVSIYSPFTFFNPMAVILDSSPESDPKSCWVVVAVFCFPLLLYFLGLISGCNFQQWFSSWPSFEQCYKPLFIPL